MSRDKFDIKPFLDRGYTYNEQTGVLSPPTLKTPYIEQQRGIIAKEEVIKDIPPIKLDIKTEFFIKGNVPSKKNSKRIVLRGKFPKLLPSVLHEQYVVNTNMQYQMFGIEFRRAVKFYGLEYPLRVEFTFIRGSKHRFDYSNAVEAILDLGTKNLWWDDDSADHILPSFQPYQYNKNNAGVKIKLITT